MQKPLSENQRQQLCNLMYLAFLDIRVLGWEGRAAQAGALADAFHNLPNGMWSADFDLQIFRDLFLAAYERKIPREWHSHILCGCNRPNHRSGIQAARPSGLSCCSFCKTLQNAERPRRNYPFAGPPVDCWDWLKARWPCANHNLART
jgi:hypothetical protein